MNIIITGASRGIGYQTVKHLTQQGNHKIITVSRNLKRLNELKQECQSINPEAAVYPCQVDLTDDHQVAGTLLPMVKDTFESVDILINNAGYLNSSPFGKFEPGECDRMVAVNFTSAAKLIAALIDIIAPSGHIVNIGSMGGFQGSVKFPGLAVYSATKAALACLTECLAEEYKEQGPSVNCLALGAVNTEMLQEAFPGYSPPTTAQQMSEFIANFALNGNKYFNGKVIPVSSSTP